MNVKNNSLTNSYLRWLNSGNSSRIFGKFSEITTPFTDHRNDYLQIYVSEKDGEAILTDNGSTLSELALSGCPIDSDKKKAALLKILRSFGISINADEKLFVRSSLKALAQRKHLFIQAMLAVEDAFFTVSPHGQLFFFEEVSDWLT